MKRSQPLRRRKRLKARGNTAYARREREWGYMSFCRSLSCAVGVWLYDDSQCAGPMQFMHLGKRAGFRKCPDSEGAGGCRKHHREIDQYRGVIDTLTPAQRAVFKDWLIALHRSYWDALPQSERDRWNASRDKEAA